MQTTIFRPISFGKEVFHPKSFDENSFIMDWTMEAGGMVPPHLHKYSDEHFTVTKGEVLFTVNGEKIIKNVGDTLLVPKGTTHSIKNPGKEQIGLTVTYTPCADVHRMFQIVSALDQTNPGSVMNMVKYFYISPRLGLKEFSTPQPEFIMTIMSGIVTVMGKLSGWDKLVNQFK